MVLCVVEDLSGWEISHLLEAVTKLRDAKCSVWLFQSTLSLKLFTSLKFKTPHGRLSYGKACRSLQSNVVVLGGLRLGQW